MTQNALIIIDIQNDYFDGGLMPLPDIAQAAQNAARILAYARQKEMPIFHIQHIAASEVAPFFRPGTEGCDIHVSVRPEPQERVITKGRPNAFVGTDLEMQLRDAGVTDLIVCGAMSQMCVDATTRAAVDLGFKTRLAEDACAAAQVSFNDVVVPAPQVHASIMAPLAASYAKVLSTAALLESDAST